ncbi:hypothetical protein SAMN04487779_10598 [Belnapia rosea]|uniref:Uncharacterized protein n=1 Tax=Belnapia rosea TaxID=938405 RepID=A0A1G7E2K1_9PROT|nr:hypothetical protein SAMN04487779_10598 [Belnapia rosea]
MHLPRRRALAMFCWIRPASLNVDNLNHPGLAAT